MKGADLSETLFAGARLLRCQIGGHSSALGVRFAAARCTLGGVAKELWTNQKFHRRLARRRDCSGIVHEALHACGEDFSATEVLSGLWKVDVVGRSASFQLKLPAIAVEGRDFDSGAHAWRVEIIKAEERITVTKGARAKALTVLRSANF